MPKFLIEANYTSEGLQSLVKEKPSSRQAVIRETFASIGGKLEAMYYALGDTDVIVLCELPDDVSAAAVAVAVSATGLVRTKTIPLLTIEEADRAVSTKTSYRAPGKERVRTERERATMRGNGAAAADAPGSEG